MKKQSKIFRLFILLLLPLLVYGQGNGDIEILRGKVIDAQTNEPIVSATVFLPELKTGATTDAKGNFSVKISSGIKLRNTKVKISIISYKPEQMTINSPMLNLTIKLKSDARALGEVVVKKQRYVKKNNPALELIANVIEHKDKNHLKSAEYYQNDKYEKVQFAFNKITPEFRNKKIFKQFQFVFENIDSLNGEQCLPVYLKETLYKDSYKRSPRQNKEIVSAHKAVTLNGLDNRGIEDYIKYLYQDIDIYESNVPLLSNQILSPLAGTSTTFYRFYILDTVKIDNSKYVKMYFAPKNKEDLLFQGNLYISMDGNYAIKKLELTLSKQVNINWVNDVKLIQEYAQVQDKWVLSNDQISVKFGITKKGRNIIGQKKSMLYNYAFTPQKNDSTGNNTLVSVDDPKVKQSNDFWAKNRPVELTKTEAGVYKSLDSLQNMPIIKRIVDIGMLLLTGYKDMGYFEIGPINTFYQYNEVEGLRLRFGGRTTDKLSKKINIETYGAYGFLDERPKYYLGLTYSLSNRGFMQFPVKSVKLSVQQETQLPGQEMKFLMEDNFLLSIKRGINNKMYYNRIFKAEHLNEFENHFSYTLGYKYNYIEPGGDLCFNYTDYAQHTNDINGIHVSELNVGLRYAPHESFYQGKTFRIPNYNRYPIFDLKYTAGNKIWGNDYNYQSLKLKINKRVYMSVLGYSDVVFESGKIFGKVPYPLLFTPQANQSYSYQIESYNMMNFMEFVSDKYVSFQFDHSFNGFFMNKVPLIKKLGLREMVTGKMIWGDLSDRNNPAKNGDLLKFPVSTEGTPLTYAYGNVPYVEGSVGIGNIFRILRFDLVRRFTYLDNPNVPKWGLRVRFRFDF